jgi:nitrate/TMAO reductase-like tetraheme cytochrome c subunit
MTDPEAPDGRQPDAESAGPLEPASDGAEAAAATAEEPAAPRHRHPFYLRGRRPRLPRSRAGLFALLLILGAVGFVGVFASVSLISWTETADFCGRCHTMAPELQAYHAGPHRDVSCGECHVEPGIAGWVKAKMNGTRQLIDVVLGTFPTPIEPPDHGALPATADTCQKCHALDQRQFVGLRTKTGFSEDEANTRQFVGLMIRPGGGNTFDVDRSVHWHVLNDVEYSAPGVNAPVIDYVTADKPDGQHVEFIAGDKITDADNVQPDIDAITAAYPLQRMTCYDCHNRIGHSVGNPRTGIDYEMYSGGMDSTLPYIKREAMRILWSSYPDEETAAAEADKLVDFYKTNYPEVYATKLAQITEAINVIKVLYRKTATPEMKVTAKTYADNLGHTDFPGCFRCHDGGHYQVVDGKATKKVIPSTCDTCHTFPQIGPAVASVPLGEPPSTHVDDQLWVFNHKAVATSIDPGGQTCGECHARDYCVNCHATGAVTVDHDEMATNHAKIIREQGNTACAYCHQPAYCARCHKDPVLPITTPFSEGVESSSPAPSSPAGVLWPLAPRG